jgi:hypothetical protein
VGELSPLSSLDFASDDLEDWSLELLLVLGVGSLVIFKLRPAHVSPRPGIYFYRLTFLDEQWDINRFPSL